MYKFYALLILVAAVHYNNVLALSSTTESDIEGTTETLNDTAPQDLYVIRTVVYEVGILTDAGNDTEDNSTHEQIDLSFYDTNNGSGIDLNNIPLPIQTNVSETSVTGILPTNLTNLIGLINGTNPILPDKEVAITQNISTSDPDSGKHIISSLSKVLGLPTNNVDTDKSTTTTENSEKIA